eukprot:m.170034 g.170034  ORF g.170034 m.170034 type:complete len:75 (+) comp16484_c1_seq3:185-409(+)
MTASRFWSCLVFKFCVLALYCSVNFARFMGCNSSVYLQSPRTHLNPPRCPLSHARAGHEGVELVLVVNWSILAG